MDGERDGATLQNLFHPIRLTHLYLASLPSTPSPCDGYRMPVKEPGKPVRIVGRYGE